MARKITEQAVAAFLAGRPFKGSNTTVELSPLGQVVVLKLHGNAIARYDHGDTNHYNLEVCDGGHQSRTTKEHLNALPGVRVTQKAGQWFLNDHLWSGNWTHVGQWNERNLGDRKVPNLDAADDDELRQFFKNHENGKNFRLIFPREPLGARGVVRDLANYAINLLVARAARTDGRITEATTYEAICQRIYTHLPRWARW